MLSKEFQEVETALCWRKFCIPIASIFPLRYDLLVAGQIQAAPDTLFAVDRCREARHVCRQSPEQSDLLFAPYSALLSPLLPKPRSFAPARGAASTSSLCSPEQKLRCFLQRRSGRSKVRCVSRDTCALHKLN